MWTPVVVPSSAGTSHHAPWPEDALTGSVLRPRPRWEARVGAHGSAGSQAYAEPIATHYETLGVSPNATSAEIRAAYLDRARRHHPDVAAAGGEAISMAELNRAYHVLGRSATRLEYDRQLAGAPQPSPAGASTDDDVDEMAPPSPGSRAAERVLAPSGPARMPWKLMAVTAVVGSAVVLASAALTDSPEDEPPDGILRVGSCVAVEPNLDAREVDCEESDLVVRLLLPTGSVCPQPYASHRDRLGLGTACIEEAG